MKKWEIICLVFFFSISIGSAISLSELESQAELKICDSSLCDTVIDRVVTGESAYFDYLPKLEGVSIEGNIAYDEFELNFTSPDFYDFGVPGIYSYQVTFTLEDGSSVIRQQLFEVYELSEEEYSDNESNEPDINVPITDNESSVSIDNSQTENNEIVSENNEPSSVENSQTENNLSGNKWVIKTGPNPISYHFNPDAIDFKGWFSKVYQMVSIPSVRYVIIGILMIGLIIAFIHLQKQFRKDRLREEFKFEEN
jgi:hypothetical protein